jgi:hypothetical protein
LFFEPVSQEIPMTRRELMTAAGAVAFTAASQSRVLGANGRMSIALIGCGARGSQLQPYFQAR